MDNRNSNVDPLRLGVAGLGRGFMLMLPTLSGDSRIILAGAADPCEEKQAAFRERFNAPATESFDKLCSDPTIDAVYIATPHETHRQLVIQALNANKHVLVEKPMTISVEDAQAIVHAAQENAKEVIVGPSHSFDTPIVETAKLLRSGKYGPVGMVHAHYFTDFVFRPRRPEELDTQLGGGVVFNQGAHHIDILLTLIDSPPRSVYAHIGNFDSRRPCDGAYSALIDFENNCFASISYSGYAHYDSDKEMGWISEIGLEKNPDSYGTARRKLTGLNESKEKSSRGFTRANLTGAQPSHHEHFGNILVSCQKADIKPTADGIHIYADESANFIPLPLVGSPRTRVIDELYALVKHGTPPVHCVQRGLTSTALCDAMYTSVKSQQKIEL